MDQEFKNKYKLCFKIYQIRVYLSLKDQIRMNVNKSGYNLRNKFQVNQPLRIHNHYGEAIFVYFCSKFIINFILEDLKNNFYTYRKL